MIPYILGIAGGFLLGNSITKFAKGGRTKARKLYAILSQSGEVIDYVEVENEDMDEARNKFSQLGVNIENKTIYFSKHPPYFYARGGRTISKLTDNEKRVVNDLIFYYYDDYGVPFNDYEYNELTKYVIDNADLGMSRFDSVKNYVKNFGLLADGGVAEGKMTFEEFKKNLPDLYDVLWGDENAVYKAKYDKYQDRFAYFKNGRINSDKVLLGNAYKHYLVYGTSKPKQNMKNGGEINIDEYEKEIRIDVDDFSERGNATYSLIKMENNKIVDLIEIEGSITRNHDGRDYFYEFEPNWFHDEKSEKYYDSNYEKIEDEIINAFYDKI